MIKKVTPKTTVSDHDDGWPEYDNNTIAIYVFKCTFWNIVQIHSKKVNLAIPAITKGFPFYFIKKILLKKQLIDIAGDNVKELVITLEMSFTLIIQNIF